MLGISGLPLVAIPHPLAGNAPDLVEAKARAVAAEVALALTGDAEAIAARYAERFLGLTERRLERGAVCVDAVCALEPAIARDASAS